MTPLASPRALQQQLTHENWVARSRCLAQVGAEELVVLAPGTAWRILWELLMLGPFAECVLDDGGQMRHVTAGALLSSAARRSSPPGAPLEAADYPPLLMFTSEITLVGAARLIIEPGWNHAVVLGPLPRLITPRAVLRSLLNAPSDDSYASDGCHGLTGVSNDRRAQRPRP